VKSVPTEERRSADELQGGPSLDSETWETTNSMARKRRLPHRRWLEVIDE